ncbi:MAG: L-threonylcarbamoyladenylate synthase [Acidobacteriaceae bacterium]
MTDDQIHKAAAVLKKGGAVVFPTDTAYGLAVDATNPKAVSHLYRIKAIKHPKPELVIFPNIRQAAKIVHFPKSAKVLVKDYWPGPLTLVLTVRSKAKIWKVLGAGGGTLGIRNPNNKTALALAKALNRPITATSANLTGHPASYSVADVKKDFAKAELKPDFYLDGGKLKKIQPSTIVAIDKNQIQLVREGPIPFSEIKQKIKCCIGTTTISAATSAKR